MLGIRLAICPSFSCRQSQRPFSAKKSLVASFRRFFHKLVSSVPALKRGSNNVLKRTLTNCFSSRPLFGLDKVFTEKQGNEEEDGTQTVKFGLKLLLFKHNQYVFPFQCSGGFYPTSTKFMSV